MFVLAESLFPLVADGSTYAGCNIETYHDSAANTFNFVWLDINKTLQQSEAAVAYLYGTGLYGNLFAGIYGRYEVGVDVGY